MTDERPTHLDLFSGIGGFALAAQWAGFRTVAFCEIDKYCQRVLAKNFLADADLRRFVGTGEQSEVEPDANVATLFERSSIHSNIFDFDGTQYRGASLLTGGFPCQPFSVAGKRRGAEDDRAIWPEMLRVIGEARPAWVLVENVPGIIPMELDNVLSSLERIGYACRTLVIPACAVDARHRRDRVWIIGRLADAMHRFQSSNWKTRRMGRQWIEKENAEDGESTGINWLPEPDVGRVAHGIPSRVDRLKGLGNAIVPQVAYEILREIRRLI